MKRSNTSSTRPSALLISARTASSTMELKTSGRCSDSRCASFTCATTSRAFSTVSMKGNVRRRKSIPANWVRSEEPRASTVMPVRSETKKARFRWGMGGRSGRGGELRFPYNYKFPPARHSKRTPMANRYVLPLETLRMADVPKVGGKNASLGELISQLAASGVRVPGGFATTAPAFNDFLAHNKLADRINQALARIDVDDVGALAKAGAQIRRDVEAAALPPELEKQIRDEYARVASTGAGSAQQN